MSINLTNFVKINILNHIDTNIKGTRDTALLLSFSENETGKSVVKTTKSNYSTILTDSTELYYANVFYANGGVNLDVLKVNSSISTTDFKTLMENTDVVDIKYVVIGECGLEHTEFEKLITSIDLTTQDGIYHKLYVGETTAPDDWKSFEDVKIENYILKMGSKGTSMTVLAYLTQINVHKSNTCKDYAFTLVHSNSDAPLIGSTNNNDVKNCIEKNYNIDAIIDGNNVRVVGGNDTAGYSIINQFMLIVLHQTLTERLLRVLFNKIKYNDYGVASILSAMVLELNYFNGNGFLVNNKIWEYDDLYYNNQLIINQNSPIPNGYKVVVMPFSTLTEEDKKAHKLPNIYVLLATSYGIRKVEIVGEVF